MWSLDIAPRMKDIAYGIRCFCCVEGKLDKNKERAFIKEYEKVSKISKKEKKMIRSFIVRDNCLRFWWFYTQMKKNPGKRYECMQSVINLQKNLK